MRRWLGPIIILALALGIAACQPTESPVKAGKNDPFASTSEKPLNETQLRRRIETTRLDKDRDFRNSQGSPLPAEERAGFSGLKYYPVDNSYRVDAQLQRYNNNEHVKMLTSNGEPDDYLRYGALKFDLNGVNCSLDVFKPADPNADPDHLFMPFRDETSGKETYGAGRYLELRETDNAHYVLDFNLAFNPYCAYNHNYSCPIPPAQNSLKTPVRAGEKTFHAN